MSRDDPWAWVREERRAAQRAGEHAPHRPDCTCRQCAEDNVPPAQR